MKQQVFQIMNKVFVWFGSHWFNAVAWSLQVYLNFISYVCRTSHSEVGELKGPLSSSIAVPRAFACTSPLQISRNILEFFKIIYIYLIQKLFLWDFWSVWCLCQFPLLPIPVGVLKQLYWLFLTNISREKALHWASSVSGQRKISLTVGIALLKLLDRSNNDTYLGIGF